jgi:hypothetical protein
LGEVPVSVPWVGWVATISVVASPSGSVAASVMPTGVFSSVFTTCGVATGAPPTSVEMSVVVRSFGVQVTLSVPRMPALATAASDDGTFHMTVR